MAVEDLIADLNAQLSGLGESYEDLALRDKVLRLVAILKNVRKLNVKVAQEGGADANDARRRILLYLTANVGIPVHANELEVVSGISEYARRVRELRTEEGYAVSTHYTGRPDLAGNLYVLESIDRVAEPHDRHISNDVQQEVYRRDNNSCQLCGGTLALWTRPGSSMLELHHVLNHVNRGSNLANNLLVLCNACHDDVHAGRIALPNGELDPLINNE